MGGSVGFRTAVTWPRYAGTLRRRARTVRYLPAISERSDEQFEKAAAADVAVVDWTVWSDDVLPQAGTTPHPRIGESLARLPRDDWVRVTHLDHTNPVLDADGLERLVVEVAGFGVVERDDVFTC